MRWVFLILTVFAVAGVGVFAIYSWKWKGPSTGSERIRTEAYAQELAAACGASCSVRALDRITRNLWRVRISGYGRAGSGYGRAGREARCFDIDLTNFRSLSGERRDFAGAPLVDCGVNQPQ